MAAAIPSTEPLVLVQGDTWLWELSLPDYPASAGWVLSYAFRSAAGKIDITGAADGDLHKINPSAATTAAFPLGDFNYEGYVTKGSERYTVRSGFVTVRRNLAAESAAYDGRSFNKKMLDAIQATLLGQATDGVLKYTIGGRSLERIPRSELMKMESVYAGKVARENGLGQGKSLGVVFGRL